MFAVFAYLLAAALLALVVGLVIGDQPGVRGSLVVNNGAHVAGVAACLAIARRRVPGGWRRLVLGGREGKPVRAWRLALGVLLLSLGLCPLVRDLAGHVLLWLRPGYQFPSHPTIEALHDPSVSWGVASALWLGALIVAPAAEEIFFRGFVQTFLLNVTGRRWAAIVMASTAFGLVHVRQPQAVAALFVLGVLLGYAYERTGSLLPPIAAHAMFNFKTLVWDALSR